MRQLFGSLFLFLIFVTLLACGGGGGGGTPSTTGTTGTTGSSYTLLSALDRSADFTGSRVDFRGDAPTLTRTETETETRLSGSASIDGRQLSLVLKGRKSPLLGTSYNVGDSAAVELTYAESGNRRWTAFSGIISILAITQNGVEVEFNLVRLRPATTGTALGSFTFAGQHRIGQMTGAITITTDLRFTAATASTLNTLPINANRPAIITGSYATFEIGFSYLLPGLNAGRALTLTLRGNAAVNQTFNLATTGANTLSYEETNLEGVTLRTWIVRSGTVRVVSVTPTVVTLELVNAVFQVDSVVEGNTATGVFTLNGPIVFSRG